jgi:hypothetical protein
MAFTPYHKITGSTSQEVELLALGDIPRNGVKSILLTNVHASATVTVGLYLFKDSVKGGSSETYYFLHDYQIAYRGYLILDNPYLLNFDNSVDTGYSLYIEVGSSDEVDVMIMR